MSSDEVAGVGVSDAAGRETADGEATGDTPGEATLVDVSPAKAVGESAATATGAAEVVVGCSALANGRPPACAATPIADTVIRAATSRRRTGSLLPVQRTERALDLGIVASSRFACRRQRAAQLVCPWVVYALQRAGRFDGFAGQTVASLGDFVGGLMWIVDGRL